MACPMGQRILELLEQKDMKQKDLAQKLGITEVSVSRYINGTHTPHTDIVVKMADILGVSADYLLGRCDTPWPSHVDGKIKEGALPFNISFKEVKPGEFEIDFGDFMSKDDITFYKKYKQLTPEQKKILEMMADQMLGKEVPRKGD